MRFFCLCVYVCICVVLEACEQVYRPYCVRRLQRKQKWRMLGRARNSSKRSSTRRHDHGHNKQPICAAGCINRGHCIDRGLSLLRRTPIIAHRTAAAVHRCACHGLRRTLAVGPVPTAYCWRIWRSLLISGASLALRSLMLLLICSTVVAMSASVMPCTLVVQGQRGRTR